MDVIAEEYSEKYLKASWRWLKDKEIKHLARVRTFSYEDQSQWFEQLSKRHDYKIWGISIDSNPIGAFGLKHIKSEQAEFWGYIGEKSYWGKGIGHWMVQETDSKALELGLRKVSLRVMAENFKAVNLYFKHFYKIELFRENEYFMSKTLDYHL